VGTGVLFFTGVRVRIGSAVTVITVGVMPGSLGAVPVTVAVITPSHAGRSMLPMSIIPQANLTPAQRDLLRMNLKALKKRRNRCMFTKWDYIK
jgi:hypothetical protein